MAVFALTTDRSWRWCENSLSRFRDMGVIERAVMKAARAGDIARKTSPGTCLNWPGKDRVTDRVKPGCRNSLLETTDGELKQKSRRESAHVTPAGVSSRHRRLVLGAFVW